MSNRIYSSPPLRPLAPSTPEKDRPKYILCSGRHDALRSVPSSRRYFIIKGQTNPLKGSQLLRFPSGLTLEHLPPRRRPLWPLVLCALLIWSAVAVSIYYLFT